MYKVIGTTFTVPDAHFDKYCLFGCLVYTKAGQHSNTYNTCLIGISATQALTKDIDIFCPITNIYQPIITFKAFLIAHTFYLKCYSTNHPLGLSEYLFLER